MDELKKQEQEQEFNLEDILKEFSGDEESLSREEQVDILKEFGVDPAEGEDVLIWDGTLPAEPRQPALPQDTVRLDQITKAVREQQEQLDQTVAFTPVHSMEEEEELPPPVIPQEPQTEPFSESWEPEYEQPISDYIPPEPIVFRPKSRLRELKKKLVAGPEKRYYELTEKGLGKLQLAIFFSLLVALLSAGATAMYTFGMVGIERIRLLIFAQFLFLLLSALLGSYQLLEGLSDITGRRFSLNSLMVFGLAACLVDGLICLQELRVPCCASFCLHMTMSLWDAYHRRNTEMGQMDTMRKATRLDSVVRSGDCYDGRSAFLRAEGQVEDFMDVYDQPSGFEKTLNWYAFAVLLVSVGAGIAAVAMHSLHFGLQVFSATILVGAPPTIFITLSRPMGILERRMHKLGTVICGWQGVRNLSRNGVFPVKDDDLFPAGSVKMNGVKFYGSRTPDEVVAYAAGLITASGGAMAPLFAHLLDSRNGYHYEAENLHYYSGGIGAEVNGEAVLAGTLSCMQQMGVEIPNGTRVNQAVYVAIDGVLSGVFAITYNKTKDAAVGLTTLCAYRGLTPVLTAADFMLTEGFLRSRFSINTRRLVFPEQDARRALAEKEPAEEDAALALTTAEGLAPAAYAVTGARALRSAAVTGTVVHMLGGILGLIMMVILAVLNAEHLLTPANVLLYELIWMIPGLLITEWTRSV